MLIKFASRYFTYNSKYNCAGEKTMTKHRKLLLLLILILLFMPVNIALADIGPKPTMEFEFTQELPDGQVTITSGILYECEQSDCSDAAPLEELGPQRFTCEELSCSALAYGFASHHRLEIQFSDGITRSSNIFETGGFDSVYLVTVRSDDLLVELTSATAAPTDDAFSPSDGFPRTASVILVCICAAVGGLALIGLIIFAVRRSAKK
jgi:hypothetical protein